MAGGVGGVRPLARRSAVLLLAGLALCACRSDGPKAEAEATLAHVDRLVAAPLAQKPHFIQLLRNTPCKDTEVCRLRDRCADGYKHLVAARDVSRNMRAKLAGSKAVPVGSALAAVDKAEAQRKLAEGQLKECQALAGRLRLRFRL